MSAFLMAKKRILDALHPKSEQRRGLPNHIINLNVRDVQELFNAWNSADMGMRRYFSENEELRERIKRLEKQIPPRPESMSSTDERYT